MPIASIIVPAHNGALTIAETLASLSAQTFRDLEIIVVDDGSKDRTAEVARAHGDPRVRIVQQDNRGLAGARNSGIAYATGAYVGFCDADDLWMPDKLARHIAHLEANPMVGLSYAGSALIDTNSKLIGIYQRPQLNCVQAQQVFKRNPVGNGSVAVMRRAALDAIAWRPEQEKTRDWWFDETFRQSEDIECWLRLALSTDWDIEGISGTLTLYRVNPSGLSANTDAQLASWERVVAKLTPINPAFFKRYTSTARAYQLRYLCRRAVSARDGATAWRLARQSVRSSLRPLLEEPAKTAVTMVAAGMLHFLGPVFINKAQSILLPRN